MDMVELLRRAKESAKHRSDEERRQLLIDAKILTKLKRVIITLVSLQKKLLKKVKKRLITKDILNVFI